MKQLKYKKDKEQGLKDNIMMRFKGFGWQDAHTTWSKNGKKKTIPVLQDALINIINATKKRQIPDKPPIKVPQRKALPIIGHLTDRVRKLDEAAMATADDMELSAHKEWKDRDESGHTSMVERVLGTWKEEVRRFFCWEED